MAVSSTYIGVIILLLILIGFVLTVIRTLANSAGARIRQDMNKVLTSYDDLISAKSYEYKELCEKFEAAKNKTLVNLLNKNTSNENNVRGEGTTTVVAKEQQLSASSFIKKDVKHRDIALADGYNSIKTEFRNIDEQIKENVKIVSYMSERSEFDKAIVRVVNSLSIDNVYTLSLDSPNDQLKFFKNTLNEKDIVVLDKYLETTRKKKFSTIDFYDWLKIRSLEVSGEVKVRSGNTDDDNYDYEPSICEGYQIISGNKLYDYSISKRDIQ